MVESSPSTIAQRTLRLLLRSVPLVPGPELYDLIEALKNSRKSIDEKVRKAVASVEEATGLFDEIESTLKERSRQLEELRAEVQRYSELADVEEKKAAALIRQIEGTLNRGRTTERIVSFGINLLAGVIFFVLGAWLGPKLSDYFQHRNSVRPAAQASSPKR